MGEGRLLRCRFGLQAENSSLWRRLRRLLLEWLPVFRLALLPTAQLALQLLLDFLHVFFCCCLQSALDAHCCCWSSNTNGSVKGCSLLAHDCPRLLRLLRLHLGFCFRR
jgi:hypothetical protein